MSIGMSIPDVEAPPGAPLPRKRAGVDAGQEAASELSGAAFGALVESTRSTVRARALTELRAGPAQMFEAPADAARSAGRSVQETPMELQKEARLSRFEAPGQGVSPSATAKASTAFQEPHRATNPSPSAPDRGPTPSRPSSARVPRSAPPTSAGTEARVFQRTGGESSQSPSSELARTPVPRPGAAVAGTKTVPASGATTAASTPTAPGHSPATPSVARQVGGLLSSPRTVETAPVTQGLHGGGERTANPPQAAPPRPADRPSESPPPRPTQDTSLSPFERLVQALRLHVGSRVSTARMQLHPPELGRMRVDVRVEGDRVEVDVRTESQAAREVVHQRAGELKLALAQHGMEVRRFDVVVQNSEMERRTDAIERGPRRPGTEERQEREVESGTDPAVASQPTSATGRRSTERKRLDVSV